MRHNFLPIFLIFMVMASAPVFAESWPADDLGHDWFFSFSDNATFLHNSFVQTGQNNLNYMSAVNESMDPPAPDHAPLSIYMTQGWAPDTPNQVNGTVYMSDGSTHSFSVQTYPVYVGPSIPVGNQSWGIAADTRMVWILDGVTNQRTSFLTYDTAYIDIVASYANGSTCLVLCPEPSDELTYYMQAPVVFSRIPSGVYIIGYDIRGNAPEQYYVHGRSVRDLGDGFTNGYTTIDRVVSAKANNPINYVTQALGYAVGFAGVIAMLVGMLGILLDPDMLFFLIVFVMLADVAYHLNYDKNIWKAFSNIFKDFKMLVEFILGFINLVIVFFQKVVYMIRAMWPL